MLEIRLATADDWPAIWLILEPIFRAGDSYPFPVTITEHDAKIAWVNASEAVFVGINEDGIIGTYQLQANKPGLGGHVANCGFAVSPMARGKGVASQMCAHSLHAAVERGYRAMQYNLVVSTNASAIKAWQRNGLEIVGTLPKAFHHARLGYVDAYVMYRQLIDEDF